VEEAEVCPTDANVNPATSATTMMMARNRIRATTSEILSECATSNDDLGRIMSRHTRRHIRGNAEFEPRPAPSFGSRAVGSLAEGTPPD
jgi:hypothetical protein